MPTQLTINLSGTQDVDVHTRSVCDSSVIPGWPGIGDYTSKFARHAESITMHAVQLSAAAPGVYYVAVDNCGLRG